jgi:drug/metabolite transporter (DMT)-like permease
VMLAAYGIGMSAVMMTLALLAGGARDRLLRILRRALPRVHRISGALLLIAGAYLSYYWLRILFGPVATLADDPIVGSVQRFTTRIEWIATANASTILTVSLVVVGAVASYIGWRAWHSKRQPAGDGDALRDGASQSLPQRVDAGRS